MEPAPRLELGTC